MIDFTALVKPLKTDVPGVRLRMGSVVSVQTNQTCTVTIAGDATQIAGVPYMGVQPVVGSCWIATDGYDVFVLGQLAKWDTGAWLSYTPTLGVWTLGNGTITGKYRQSGKTVTMWAILTLGTTSVAHATTSPTFTLPVARSADPLHVSFPATFHDTGVNTYGARAEADGSGAATFYGLGASGVRQSITATVPFTWGTGDQLSFTAVYETT